MRPAWVRDPVGYAPRAIKPCLLRHDYPTRVRVSADVSEMGKQLWCMRLDAANPDEGRDDIKQRYERRLKEFR